MGNRCTMEDCLELVRHGFAYEGRVEDIGYIQTEIKRFGEYSMVAINVLPVVSAAENEQVGMDTGSSSTSIREILDKIAEIAGMVDFITDGIITPLGFGGDIFTLYSIIDNLLKGEYRAAAKEFVLSVASRSRIGAGISVVIWMNNTPLMNERVARAHEADARQRRQNAARFCPESRIYNREMDRANISVEAARRRRERL